MTSLFDQEALVRQRNLSAKTYFTQTDLPQMIERELVDRLDVLTLEPETLLVLGCVGGTTLSGLRERFGNAHISVVDTSVRMLKMLENEVNKTDLERVSFTVLSGWQVSAEQPPADLVFSNLYLPLCDDLGALFGQLHRAMKPDGCLHFSSLGPDSFIELREAWKHVDPDNLYHVLEPPDMHDVGDALVHGGFREPVMDRDNYTMTYSSANALMTDLRKHGVRNGFTDRMPGLTGRKLWARFVNALTLRQEDGRLSLTAEVVVGQAWRGDGMSQHRREDGGVGIAFDELAKGLRRGR